MYIYEKILNYCIRYASTKNYFIKFLLIEDMLETVYIRPNQYTG